VADWSRVIAHLDMDAFFASIEQQDHPEYRGRPVVVGADPQGGQGRGVVAAASYEAREYGIKSAMPIRDAYRACPHAVYVRPRGERYREVAHTIREILARFTDTVEPASIDEAYLDLTSALEQSGDDGPEEIARELKRTVKDNTGLTASIGIAPTKSCAKIASDMDKPDGLTIVHPDEVTSLLAPLPVKRIPGVGPKTAARLHELGIQTIGDLAERSESWARQEFGENGVHVWRLAHGIDPRPVAVDQGLPKSRSEEHTFMTDERDVSKINRVVRSMARQLVAEMESRRTLFRVVGLKIRTWDFETMTRATTLPHPTRSLPTVLQVLTRQLGEFLDGTTPYRLVGVRLAGLERDIGQRTLEEYLDEAGPADRLARVPGWALPDAEAPRPGQHRFGRDW
jgi:nucleotidyltransferase/DNA polymerase involved in DNA repair